MNKKTLTHSEKWPGFLIAHFPKIGFFVQNLRIRVNDPTDDWEL